jgi:hypothetical protein
MLCSRFGFDNGKDKETSKELFVEFCLSKQPLRNLRFGSGKVSEPQAGLTNGEVPRATCGNPLSWLVQFYNSGGLAILAAFGIFLVNYAEFLFFSVQSLPMVLSIMYLVMYLGIKRRLFFCVLFLFVEIGSFNFGIDTFDFHC